MQITTIGVTYTRKVNLGDYEAAEATINYFAKLDAENPEELDDETAIQCLIEKAQASVKLALKPVCEASKYWQDKAVITRKFMGQVVTEEVEF